MPINNKICVASRPGIGGPYGYVPTLAAGIVFCVLYFLSIFAHTFVAIRHRVWWQLLFSIGGLCELLGWAGRTWSSDCPYQLTPFLMQTTLLILGKQTNLTLEIQERIYKKNISRDGINE